MNASPGGSVKADDLLSRAAAAQLANDPAVMQPLALACHARMLEWAATDLHQAVRHALVGARLLGSLVARGGNPPDWLLIHEEQCCRYGCIWIHDLLQAGNPVAGIGVADALQLLARMEQLHPEPVDWAPVLRASLLNQQPAPAPDLRIVLVGNGQCHPLMLGLRQALPRASIHCCSSVHLATPEEVSQLQQQLRYADLLVLHTLQPGSRNGLDTASLRAQLPPTATTLVLPNLHFEGHHPFISPAHDPDGRLASLAAESPLGRQHDFLAMAAAALGLPLDTLLQAPSEAQIAHIQQWHRQSIQELALHERNGDITISDWIEQHHRLQPLMHTPDHPTQLCLDPLLRRLLQRIDPRLSWPDDRPDRHEPQAELSLPIHPWVQQALDLEPWAHSWGQRRGEPFTTTQQLQASLAFYQRHPWILQNNRHHPRFERAQRLLGKPHPQGWPGSGPAANPRRQPTLAALINYFDDSEMLSWQLRSGCLDPYDRIYIWDGPYHYSSQLAFGDAKPGFLADSPLGQRLLADPRVVYRQGQWHDEAEKRIEAFAAIDEDLIILHDTDEFFFLDRSELERFWHSGHDIAEHLTQNLYAGGLLASDIHHRSASAATLPCKRIIFRNNKIAPAQHLDYLWLVGVKQNHGDDSKVSPVPLGHTLHLTGCRSTNGQIGKMSFYKSLALSQQAPDPVLHSLRLLIEAGALSPDEALLLFLRGDPGFAGIPHPDSGLSLQPCFPDPRFPAGLLASILADSHRVNTGSFPVLEGYPLVLWFPATTQPRPLRFALAAPGPLQLRSWLWFDRQPALASPPIAATTDALLFTLPAAAHLMGTLVQIQIQPTAPSPRCQVLQVSAC
jgi:hypothetical protein